MVPMVGISSKGIRKQCESLYYKVRLYCRRKLFSEIFFKNISFLRYLITINELITILTL